MDLLTDILLVEDVTATVEGLELDLSSRGGAVILAQDAQRARRELTHEPLHLALFDLRIPESEGQEPRLDVGLNLIRELVAGVLGDVNRVTPFGIVSQQTVVDEIEEFRGLPQFVGAFSKSEDTRRLFRVLRELGMLKTHEFDEDGLEEVRRRVKFLLRGLAPSGREVIAAVPAMGHEDLEISLRALRPTVRRRVLDGPLPVFAYGTANVASATAETLEPRDLDEVVEMPAHRDWLELDS